MQSKEQSGTWLKHWLNKSVYQCNKWWTTACQHGEGHVQEGPCQQLTFYEPIPFALLLTLPHCWLTLWPYPTADWPSEPSHLHATWSGFMSSSSIDSSVVLSLGAVKVAVAIPAEAVASPPLATGDSLAGGAYVRPEERATGSHGRGVWALPSLTRKPAQQDLPYLAIQWWKIRCSVLSPVFGWGS